MRVAEKAISNTVYLFMQWIIVTFFSFIYWLIAGKLLLPSDYGKVSTAFQLINLINLLTAFGLGGTISKLVPVYASKKEFGKISSLVRNCLKFSFTAAFLAGILFLLSYPFTSPYLKLDFFTYFLIFLGILSARIHSIFSITWYGLQRMDKMAKVSFAIQLIKVISSAMLIYLGLKHFGPIAALVFCFLAGILLYFNPSFIEKPKKINFKRILKELSFPIYLGALGWILVGNTQYIILTILKSVKETGIYSLAFTICSQLAIIPMTFSRALFPLISILSEKKQKETQSKLLTYALKYSLLIGLPSIAILYFFRNFIVLFMARKEYLEASRYFALLAPSALTFGIANLLCVNLLALGYPKVFRNLRIFIAILYFLTALTFTHFYAGMGLAISYALLSLIYFFSSFYLVNKKVRIKIGKINLTKLLPIFIIFSFLLFLIDQAKLNIILKFLLFLASSLVYLFLSKTFVLTREDERVLELIVKKARQKFLKLKQK